MTLDYSRLRRFYPIWFMLTPSLNNISVIQCNLIWKRQHYRR